LKKGDKKAALICISLPLISAAVAAALSAAGWLSLLDLLSNVSRQPRTLEGQLSEAIPISEFARALISPVAALGVAGKPVDVPGLAF